MSSSIYPNSLTYGAARVQCACGNTFETRSTRAELRTEVCSACHPFFTGEQRVVDSAGRIERFNRRWRSPAT